MFIFLSHKIDSDTPVYGGKEGFISKSTSSIKNGDNANTSNWSFPNHIGTHIDFPYHFYDKGQTIEDFSPDLFIYKEKDIQLLEFDLPKNKLLIKPDYLKEGRLNTNSKIILLKTGADSYRKKEKFWKYNPGISVEMAKWIQNTFQSLQLIGIDSISISSWQHREIGRKVHKIFLNPKNPILLVEDMNLSKVNKKTQIRMIIIAPMRVSHANGCPCTVLAEVNTNR